MVGCCWSLLLDRCPLLLCVACCLYVCYVACCSSLQCVVFVVCSLWLFLLVGCCLLFVGC